MYDFFNPAGSSGESITIIGITWQYWLGVLLSLFAIASLFIFKKTYVKFSRRRYLMVSLGIFQLLLYFLYYALHFIYLYGLGEKDNNLRGWTWIVPLHLSSITQIISAILLIKPNSKLFSITAPWTVIMVFASILIPANKSFGPQHFSYWSYYILHIIIIFTYWYLYMYGFVQYQRQYLLSSFVIFLLFALLALGWNGLSLAIARIPEEVTNLLFIGPDGYPLWGKITSANIWTSGKNNVLWPLGYFPMAILGIIFIALSHMLISRIQPFYQQKKGKLIRLKRQKQKWDIKAFKDMWSNFKCIWVN